MFLTKKTNSKPDPLHAPLDYPYSQMVRDIHHFPADVTTPNIRRYESKISDRPNVIWGLHCGRICLHRYLLRSKLKSEPSENWSTKSSD
jgi:hypothetical protein